MTDLTRAIVRRTRTLTHADLPAEIRALARQCMHDAIAVAIAGADDELVRILRAELEEAGGTPQASVWGSTLRLPAGAAALLNGTMAHALDYDDVNLAMPGHPTVAILPAVLALGEARGASGAEVMAAFVAGYETACRIGLVMAPGHYDIVGFHATGTIGTFGAAAGCAHLLGLDEERTLHALGIAATQAAGLKSMFGTMCKPLHAGKAAQNGLLAAKLAARGFTARPDSLECVQGFARTHSPDFHPEAALAEPEGGFYIRANLFKYHAACYLTHAGIEAARMLRDRPGVTADTIAAITLRVDKSTDRVCNIANPTTGLEAKFSHRLTAAMALAGLETSRLDSFTAEVAADPRITALRDKVSVELLPRFGATHAIIDIRLSDQTTLSAEHDAGIPAANVAHQGERIRAKFDGLLAPLLGPARTAALGDAIETIDSAGSVATLAPLWTA
jgi:2-methylcitrate dehydratase PrpD